MKINSDILQSQNKFHMSLTLLIEDQINKLFSDNPELKTVKKNKFEIAVSHFISFTTLNGIETDDLIDGIMGDGGDEGIDMCYIFCNGKLVNDEQYPITSDSTIKVKFIQAKKEDSFSTDQFRKTKEGLEEIFNLDIGLDKLQHLGANPSLIEKADLIRKIFRRSQTERATFLCEVYYITICPNTDVSTKIKHLEEELRKNPLSISFKFEYWGGQKLLDLNKKHIEKLEVKFDTHYLEVFEKGVDTNGFAGFVKGNDLIASLIDDEGIFKSHLTEGNVRYFLGEDKKINKSIIDSAIDKTKAVNFWAMNNGVTIIGDSIMPLGSQTYNITSSQIVNGCQTIHCLYIAYQQGKSKLPDGLKVFVKLIRTENETTQTDIISATNSQNSVKSASLKANDDIQRNLETHLKKYGIFYERRENFYKRNGVTGNKVIGLLKMAQIIHTVVNKESIVATNDTATLFDTESKYNLIFHENADYELYAYAVKLYQAIWSMKNSDLRNNNYESEERDLISKSGFVFLHIISSLMFSEAEFMEKGGKKIEKWTAPFSIKTPPRKNEFVKRKKWLLEKIKDENYLDAKFEIAKKIFKQSVSKYSTETGKTKISVFKNRHFDKDYLRPAINKYFDKKKELA